MTHRVVAGSSGCETAAMDPEMQAKADADAAALQHDIEILEHEAARAGKSVARRLGPPIAVVLVLVVVAWVLGRRARNRRR
jgi:hypothetical protein